MPSLLEKSDEYKLKINLKELGFDRESFTSFKIDAINKEMFFNFVFCSPVDSEDVSHYGVKFSDIKSLTRKNYDLFFKEIVSAAEIESVNLFRVYESEPNVDGKIKERIDLKKKITAEKSTFLYLYTGGGRCEISFFVSLRNALAHGNIFEHNGFHYLYSVSSQKAKTLNEFERNINFLMRIADVNLLIRTYNVLLKYIDASFKTDLLLQE